MLTSIAGGGAAVLTARHKTRNRFHTGVSAVLALDLVGGAYVNNTRACARWYEREGQRHINHLGFSLLHLHPYIVAWLDHTATNRQNGATWASYQYLYLQASTALIRGCWPRRRILGPTLTIGGLALDAALGPSTTAPWFAAAYYPKLVLGHASAALWSEDSLFPRQDESTTRAVLAQRVNPLRSAG
jgi:hypothetical protein